MKKLHPRYKEDQGQEDEIVYSTDKMKKGESESDLKIDPRWEKLNILKKKNKD